MPDVVSYNTLLKGSVVPKGVKEVLDLLHMMLEDEGKQAVAGPDLVTYNTAIDGFFKEHEVDKAYSLFQGNVGSWDFARCCDLQLNVSWPMQGSSYGQG
ncbi:hypothetical protein PR202_gb07065 [Eleusine coracana subsp. coracana]|uniref:Uncharacterized protein n=1 Tax=Eleusine coracana subsp. coracana TaxID=191504 RepID=A0AAV5EC29_ELECO|nr:hypothetical protein PR202_gb07065 [Eleusine coracana subsp. coracana]